MPIKSVHKPLQNILAFSNSSKSDPRGSLSSNQAFSVDTKL